MKNWKYYEPEYLGFFLGILLLNVWYLSGLAIEGSILPKNYHYIITAIMMVSASFFGSYSAHHLHDKRDKEAKDKNRIEALNSALFTSLRQINAIAQLNKDLLEWKDKSNRFLFMPATLTRDYKDLKINFSTLEFLLLENNPTFLLLLSIEEERFESAIIATNMRSNIHKTELQPALSRASFHLMNPTFEQISLAAGDRITFSALKATDSMFNHVFMTHESYPKVHIELFNLAKKLYPNEKFIRLQNIQE